MARHATSVESTAGLCRGASSSPLTGLYTAPDDDVLAAMAAAHPPSSHQSGGYGLAKGAPRDLAADSMAVPSSSTTTLSPTACGGDGLYERIPRVPHRKRARHC